MSEPENANPARDGDDSLAAGLAAGFGAPSPAKAGARARSLVPEGRTSYQLEGEIARGGMGVILKGHDANLGRDVAIKVLREDLAQRPDVMRRFVEEARIGGQLQHPGIVPVYELGLMADERPYFAMKLVEGRTLSERLAARGADGERRELLDVFETVCQTLAFAHSRGVVHRDLKPANVLIGAFGEVQVLDWGLAKVLRPDGDGDGDGGGDGSGDGSGASRAETGVTLDLARAGSESIAGSVMGTPAYMPPEQARGEVARLDARSDVFSLGAILCEILTGKPPYPGETERTLEQAAGARLDDAARRLDACAADHELVELCKQCLAPDPAARPRTAGVVADRVHAYLASVEDRARKAEVRAAQAKVRARAIALFSASGVVLVLLAGGIGLWMQQERARRVAETDRVVGAALQDAILARGKQNWGVATAMLERARARLEGVDASDPLRARVASLGETIEREANEARRASQRAADNAALLDTLQAMRLPEGSEFFPTKWRVLDQRYGAVLAEHQLVVDESDPDAAARALGERGISVDLASSLDAWASVRRLADDEPGSVRLLAVADALDPDSTRRELRAALTAKDVAKLRAIAKQDVVASWPAPTVHLLAHALAKGESLNEALPILVAARRRFPQDFEIAVELARALRMTKPKRSSEAVASYEAALAMRPSNIEVWHELGQTLEYDLKRSEEAFQVFRRATERRPSDAHLVFHLGTVLISLERWEEAIETLGQAIEMQPDYGPAFCNLGIAFDRTERFDEAMATYQHSLQLDPSNAVTHYCLGITLEKLVRHEEAVAENRKAIELNPKMVEAYFRLGYALARLERHEEAIASYRKSLELTPPYTLSYGHMGDSLMELHRTDEAIAAYEQDLKLRPDNRYAHRSLAWLLATVENGDAARYAAALEHGRRAVELAPDNANMLASYGVAMFQAGDVEHALERLNRSASLREPDAAMAVFLCLANARLGHNETARHWYLLMEPLMEELLQSRPWLKRFVDEARETASMTPVR